MKNNQIVTPSLQVPSTVPLFIHETYREFVEFMEEADGSEERIGFSQNLLQNLQKYRDFNTYRNKVIKEGVLNGNITADSDELVLENGYGFPEENGILYIDEEIILYRKKEGNTFSGLQRGASGTVILPTFTADGTYRITAAAAHNTESVVYNLSTLFLASLLETIYESYAPGLNANRVSPDINNATLLEHIQDFFAAKGSKLGIKAFFKILFAENDVEVNYPGDRMITPSKSTWYEPEIVRVLPLPEVFCPIGTKLLPPDKFINSKLEFYLERYESEDIPLGEAICEYAFSYSFENEVQYEMSLQKDSLSGVLPATPKTILTRNIQKDDATITIESTLGFPQSGVFYVGNEGISYTSRSLNQFFGCKRGYIGIATDHTLGESVFGRLILRSETLVDNVKYETYCWVLALAQKVNVLDGGLLHKKTDPVYVAAPGAVDPRQPNMASFIENYDDQLVTQAALPPAMTDVTNLTAGVNSVYFNTEFCLSGSSGFPYYTIGQFSDNDSIGPDLKPNNMTFGIPLRSNIHDADQSTKGTNMIGVFVDGVPAYSDASPRKVVQGDIATFKVVTEGSGYVNPTVVITPDLSDAEATIVDGRVTAVTTTSSVFPTEYYTSNPEVRISSGENATFAITFDPYGRITNVQVTSGGQYYNDVPVLSVVDSSNRGAGSLLTASIDNGSITGVTIVDSGIDYNPATTSIVPFPIGSGAIVEATVQYYQFNRYQEVVNNPNWTFDGGNGFLYEKPDASDPRSTYGYVGSPTNLRISLNDDGSQHSPILGWALDGNPIYGPYGYRNTKNDAGGVVRMTTGYQLQSDRKDITPGGETDGSGIAPPTVGPYDPTNGVYPMGTFTEDYKWVEQDISQFGFDLLTNSGDQITTESGLELETNSSVVNPNYLDRNNGRVCNTPEFPAELYPEGIYAYFITVDEFNQPSFPYIIGTTYQNSPVEWYLDWNAEPFPEKKRFGPIPYTPTRTLDIDGIRRYRTPYLSTIEDDIDVSIATVDTGGISEILIEEALPNNSMVGDVLYYDNTGQGGTGAVGIVNYVNGEVVSTSGGELLVANLISHRQQLDLSMNTSYSYTFVKDTKIRCWNDAVAVVESYDPVTKQLIVNTATLILISPNTATDQNGALLPSFYDNLYKPVRLPGPNPEVEALGNVPLGSGIPNDIIVSYLKPTVGIGGDDLQPGDLWWSIYDGRLFIYYRDNDSEQWVVTQPIGTTPLGNLGAGEDNFSWASDDALVTGLENPPTQVLAPGGVNKITISTTAPSQRADGSPNRMGDLWWSQETGILFLWYTDGLENYYATGVYAENESNSQWVITDPAGIAPMGHDAESYSTDEIYPEEQTAGLRASIFSNEIMAMISDTAPTTQPDGSPLEFGNLFWSPKTGKMYVWWGDETGTEQWTVTNPSGSITGQYALDFFPGGEVGPAPEIVSPIGQIDERADQKLLWFDELDFFKPGDLVDFELGAPGVDELTEQAKLEALGTDVRNNGVFIRGYEDTPFALPNGTKTVNKSRALYVFTTEDAHDLDVGDKIIVSGSDFPEVNGYQTVIKAGTVIPAIINVQINNVGQVSSLSLIDGGRYYRDNFLISFTGGGGQSAFGEAIVEPLADGGSVTNVRIINNGYNYRSVPTPILGTEISNRVFYIYTRDFHGVDTGNVTYITTGQRATNTPASIVVDSGGVGYSEIPPALGLYKRSGDRATTIVKFVGGAITEVSVPNGGDRYVNPTVIFFDQQGSGSGATGVATVVDGKVTKIDVTTSGSGYKQPALELVEESGKYISLSNTIGKITSLNVDDPGKKIASDSSLRPELQILTRVIVSNPTGAFIPGSSVYQGTATNKQVTATVVDYDDKIQQITLEKVTGILKAEEKIYDDIGNEGRVKLQGEADCRIHISGSAEPVGKFINDTCKLDTKFANIQDSYYYQWFSYNVASPMQKVQYENFMQELIHPTGFIMFAELDINKTIDIDVNAEEAYISTFEVS